MLVTFAGAVLCCAYLLSCIWLFATPWTVAHQAPLPMGVLQARILEWVAMSSFRGSSWPRDRTQVSHIAGGFFTIWATREPQEYWSGYPIPSPGKLPNPEIKPGSLALQADSLAAEPQGKSKNTGVGGLSLLQGILLTQEMNQGLLHSRQILYQLSYQGSSMDSAILPKPRNRFSKKDFKI